MMASYNVEVPDSVYISSVHHLNTPSEIHKIRDWLPLSIVNLFLGCGIGGVIPFIFSMLCRSNKQNNDVNNARTMSTLALMFNIIVTIGGSIGWICLICFVVAARRTYFYSYLL
jgi:hypothetical protein